MEQFKLSRIAAAVLADVLPAAKPEAFVRANMHASRVLALVHSFAL